MAGCDTTEPNVETAVRPPAGREVYILQAEHAIRVLAMSGDTRKRRDRDALCLTASSVNGGVLAAKL
jgi:hypothetical protein